MEHIEWWHILVVAAIVCLIIETLSHGLTGFAFAIAFASAAVAAYFGAQAKGQLLAAIVGLAVSFFGVRPLFLRFLTKRTPKTRTNQEALIGRRARVVEAIDAATGGGRVQLDGDTWRAASPQKHEVGEWVVITDLDGVTVNVRKE
jgi:membrane protein implicated in regulation of membrane protease activity